MVDIFRLESFCPGDHQHREHWDDKKTVDKVCGSKWPVKPDPRVSNLWHHFSGLPVTWNTFLQSINLGLLQELPSLSIPSWTASSSTCKQNSLLPLLSVYLVSYQLALFWVVGTQRWKGTASAHKEFIWGTQTCKQVMSTHNWKSYKGDRDKAFSNVEGSKDMTASSGTLKVRRCLGRRVDAWDVSWRVSGSMPYGEWGRLRCSFGKFRFYCVHNTNPFKQGVCD